MSGPASLFSLKHQRSVESLCKRPRHSGYLVRGMAMLALVGVACSSPAPAGPTSAPAAAPTTASTATAATKPSPAAAPPSAATSAAASQPALAVPSPSVAAGAASSTGAAPAPNAAGANLSVSLAGKCGLGNGQKATGTPINVGAIVTKQPGVDFTDITNTAMAYFQCVNDNGGINGHPVNYEVEQEQTNAQQVAALAAKLIQDDKVVAIVASTSLIDCAVNHQFYEQNNFNLIVAGVPYECFNTPNISAVNMGPYYSTLGAAQYLARQGIKQWVTVSGNAPGADHDNSGPASFAKITPGITDNGVLLQNLPITDANGLAVQLVQAAGQGGGVIIDLTPPEGLKILQAAQQQGLVDQVTWAWSTPGNDASVAQALDASWNGKLGINAELNLIDSSGPSNTLYQQVVKQYAPSVPLGSFGQMGFLAADIFTKTVLQLPESQLTPQGVNAAIRQIKDYQTDLLCKPWYFGDLQFHVANNWDRTVVPQDRKMVQKEDCFEIAAIPESNLSQIRQAEQQQGLSQ